MNLELMRRCEKWIREEVVFDAQEGHKECAECHCNLTKFGHDAECIVHNLLADLRAAIAEAEKQGGGEYRCNGCGKMVKVEDIETTSWHVVEERDIYGDYEPAQCGPIEIPALLPAPTKQGGGGRVRIQPCGCVLCVCGDEERCHGCGAKMCSDPNCDVRKGKFVPASPVNAPTKTLEVTIGHSSPHRWWLRIGNLHDVQVIQTATLKRPKDAEALAASLNGAVLKYVKGE